MIKDYLFMNNEEDLVQKLESVLIPFAIQRFDISSNLQASLLSAPFLKKFASSTQARTIELVTWIVRAFVRTLVTSREPIYLADIASIAIAEAMYMLNYPPYYFLYGGGDEGAKADLKITIETEIHRWFLFLIEQGLLGTVGVYHRYMGIFKPKID